jgi:hypothetical protein
MGSIPRDGCGWGACAISQTSTNKEIYNRHCATPNLAKSLTFAEISNGRLVAQ